MNYYWNKLKSLKVTQIKDEKDDDEDDCCDVVWWCCVVMLCGNVVGWCCMVMLCGDVVWWWCCMVMLCGGVGDFDLWQTDRRTNRWTFVLCVMMHVMLWVCDGVIVEWWCVWWCDWCGGCWWGGMMIACWLGVLIYHRRTYRQTDICTSRVAFATDWKSYERWKVKVNIKDQLDNFIVIFWLLYKFTLFPDFSWFFCVCLFPLFYLSMWFKN